MDVEFAAKGYLGPVRVLTVEQCRQLLRAADDPRSPPPVDWPKGHAASSRTFYEIAAQPAIVDIVADLLGGEALLWGASIVDRNPGEAHPWHSDIETCNPAGGTVSVWIGLEHTDRRSTLHIVPGSHRFGKTVQELRFRHGLPRGETTSHDIVRWAQEWDGEACAFPLEMTDGEAVFFDGRLWHGSHNVSDATRRALLLQYARPGTPMRIADLHSMDWPFRQLDVPRPPCLLLRGDADPEVNRIVPPPSMLGEEKSPRLMSRVCRWPVPLPPDDSAGWKPYPQFRGSTAEIRDLSCHVSVLTPGSCPHPPHTHPEEELLLVLSGEVEVTLPHAPTPQRRLGSGEFVYYPAEYPHTLQAISEQPAEYLMLKWVAAERGAAEPLGHVAHAALGQALDAAGEGFRPQLLFEGATAWLRKLHGHVSTLSPGAGYEPHIDSYDVTMIVLEGEIETLGQRVPAPAVVFYAAGEPHGIRNPGASPARYLVFEFHGSPAVPVETSPAPTVETPPSAIPILSGMRDHAVAAPPPVSLLTKIRDPHRWKRKVTQAVQRIRAGLAPM